jgi:hypothetical protein
MTNYERPSRGGIRAPALKFRRRSQRSRGEGCCTAHPQEMDGLLVEFARSSVLRSHLREGFLEISSFSQRLRNTRVSAGRKHPDACAS